MGVYKKGRPFGDVKKGFASAVKRAEIEKCSGCSFERQKTDSERPKKCPDCGRKMIQQKGIEDFRFHDLRHTFGSHLVMQGVDIRTVQHLMGHKDIKMTMRYSHLSPEHVLEAMEKLDMVWTPCGHQAENVKIEKAISI